MVTLYQLSSIRCVYFFTRIKREIFEQCLNRKTLQEIIKKSRFVQPLISTNYTAIRLTQIPTVIYYFSNFQVAYPLCHFPKRRFFFKT